MDPYFDPYPLANEDIIKTKAGAREFVEARESFTILNDPAICMINGGSSQFKNLGHGDWSTFSSGPNWWDQGWSSITEDQVVERVWKARASINREIRADTKAWERSW